jgi:hypothetical protein
VAVVLPPVQTDLLGLVDRADDQANPDREELDLGQRDLDVARDDESLVEDPIEDVDQSAAAPVGRLEIRSDRWCHVRGWPKYRPAKSNP